jgi:predicted nucleic acid-binding Zn ribbon protein
VAGTPEDHRHCKVCGKVVGPGIEFCSKGCRRQREELLQNRRNLTYLLYGSIAIVVLFLVVSLLH